MKRQCKHRFLVFSIILILALNSFCFLHFVPLVHAQTTTAFDVVSDAYDGHVAGADTNYVTAHDASVGTSSATYACDFGQILDEGTYIIYRIVMRFDTSLIGDATINSAKLCLGGFTDWSITDFYVRLQNWTDGADGLDTDDYSKFDGINYDDGLFSTSSWDLAVYNNITITNFDLISKGGYTDIFIRSSRDISSTAPSGQEYVLADDTGDPQPSKLEVTYTSALAPEYDYVDGQTNVDSSADKGTHSSFAAEQATDWTNDSLIEANTNTTAINDAENFVDLNTSNIDSHTGHGTSSNFTAQQDANMLYNDTLTEANTGGTTSDVFTSGFEVGKWDSQWDGNGATTWLQGTNSTPGSPWVTHSGTNMSYALNANDGNLISDDIDLSGASSAGVSFWYMVDDEEETDFRFYYYNGSTYNLQTLDLGLAATEDVWYKYSEVITDAQYLKSNFRIDFNSLADANEGSFIDDVLINKTLNNNYELDYEFSWTTADFDEANEYLCIRTNSFSGTAENLGVDVWDGSWKSISNALTASAWNNISISTNLTGATIYFRFIGKTESSDTAQNTWSIECSLIHTWSIGVNYELDLEEQFSSANFSRTDVELCVRMGAYNTTENIRLDYWNASASAWIVAAATLTTNVWNNVSVKTYTSNASVTFTVRFVGVTESGDTERSAWDKDACLLHTWDAAIAGLVAVLSQSILLPAYNALAKELGFQSSSLILPSSMGYFWKSLPFQVTGAIKAFDSTTIGRALGFLTSGVISFFSSLSTAVGLLFQPSVLIVPSSTNYFSKAIGFQATNTAQSFGSVTMQKAMGFLTSGASNFLASMSKATELSFVPSSSIIPSATNYLSKALGFQTSAALIPSSTNSFWKALGFQATDMIRAYDSATMLKGLGLQLTDVFRAYDYNSLLRALAFQSSGSLNLYDLSAMGKANGFLSFDGIRVYDFTSMLKGIGFLSTELISVLDYNALSKEVGFQVSEFQRAENIFPSATSYFWKALGFQPTNTINVYDALGVGKGLGFLSSGTSNGFSTLLKGMSLAFQSGETIRLWDSGVMLKAIGFQPTNTIIPSSTGYFWKAIGLQPSDSIRVYDSSVMQKALGFLSAGTTNIFSTILRGIELGFTPSGVLCPFIYGSSGKETATILVDRFELARLFDNQEMLKALGFRTTGSINLFDFSAMSKSIGLLTSGTINFYDASTMLKAKGFLAVNNINVFSTVLRGVEVAFQSSGSVKLWDANSILKALGFQVNAATNLYDSATMLKALGFLTTGMTNAYSTMLKSMSLSFTSTDIVHPFAYATSGKETVTILYELSGLAKLFSTISINMAKGFSNYDLIYPSTSVVENKAVQFSLDGLVKLFSQASLGIGRIFSNFGTINPFSYLNVNKELGFSISESPYILGTLGGSPTGVTVNPYVSNIIRINPILDVRTYWPTILSSATTLYNFFILQLYPTHIEAECIPPQPNIANVQVVSVFTVPDLNYSVTVTSMAEGNNSALQDVTVPLNIFGQTSYAYHVATSYFVEQTLIGDQSFNGILSVQQWWLWMWIGVWAAVALTLVGMCVGGYVWREKQRKKQKERQATAKLNHVIRVQKQQRHQS